MHLLFLSGLSRVSLGLTALLLTVTPFSAAASTTFEKNIITSRNATGKITIPPPTGSYTVGRTTLYLTDKSRIDPLSPTPHEYRLVVAQIYYPTHPPHKLKGKYHLDGYVSERIAAIIEAEYPLPPGMIGSVTSNSYLNAPVVLPKKGPAEIVLFSPGYGGTGSIYATYHEDLASHGYIVISLDPVYDTVVIEVPGKGELWNRFNGSAVDPTADDFIQFNDLRSEDAAFVVEALGDPKSDLVTGKDWWSKDAKIAMFGHSLGGSATARSMLLTQKIVGGMLIDGSIQGTPPPPPSPGIITNPVILFGTHDHNRETDPSWPPFYGNIAKGWKRELLLNNSGHLTFSDFAPMAKLIGLWDLPEEVLPEATLMEVLGSIDGERAMAVVREFIKGFMGWVIRGDKEGKDMVEGKGIGEWPEIEVRE
ncbi:hypothetical protein BDZ91DRAFT_658909 [Kalaharituber pfeilii]|nr:hypothetical protein BDZ91DRAFT_658909 [Kalaharituber pfeilii]